MQVCAYMPSSKVSLAEDGRAFAGSRRQLQIFVNHRQDELNRVIIDGIPELDDGHATLTWVSPVAKTYYTEFRDSAFLRVLGLSHLRPSLADFWPEGGPCWDGLALVNRPALATGALLVEAKSHVKEVVASCCSAQGASLVQIEKSLDSIKAELGASLECNWLGPLYQSANRLAFVQFLRKNGVEAWLVDLLFANDRSIRTPVNEEQWLQLHERAIEGLGLRSEPAYVVRVVKLAIDPHASGIDWPLKPPRLDRSKTPTLLGPLATSILAGVDDLVDSTLNLCDGKPPRWQHKTSFLNLSPISAARAADLIPQIYAGISNNWNGTRRGEGKNWRWSKMLDCIGLEGEVGLQKWIVLLTDDTWVNAIPTASGLIPLEEEKQRNVDLAHRRAPSEYEMIELKLGIGNQHPLGAALQLAQYGCLYLHARRNRVDMALDLESHQLLGASCIHLQVLALRPFYDKYQPQADVTQTIERAMEDGFVNLVGPADNLAISFQFIQFDGGFAWPDASDATVYDALNRRSGVFDIMR